MKYVEIWNRNLFYKLYQKKENTTFTFEILSI